MEMCFPVFCSHPEQFCRNLRLIAAQQLPAKSFKLTLFVCEFPIHFLQSIVLRKRILSIGD